MQRASNEESLCSLELFFSHMRKVDWEIIKIWLSDVMILDVQLKYIGQMIEIKQYVKSLSFGDLMNDGVMGRKL